MGFLNLADAKSQEGRWYQYNEEVRFKVRHISPNWVIATRKKYVKTVRKSGVLEEIMPKDKEKDLNAEIYDYMLEDWEGVTLNGVDPAPCTVENKTILLEGFIDVASFINQKAREATADEEMVEQDLKNSETSQESE